MSTAMIIATREIRERWRLFIVAATVAGIPFLVTMINPGASGDRGSTIRAIGATAAINYAIAIALAMGVSTIGRDLTDKRLSFYFSKPISPAALWIGKAGASLFIAFICALIIVLPSSLVKGRLWNTAWIPDASTVALFGSVTVVTLFFGSHAVSTMMRSRSILVALDFVLAVATLGIAGMLLWPIVLAGGSDVVVIFGASLFGGLLLILAVAPVWQLAHGRTDARRSHAALSKFLWTWVAGLLLLGGGFALWLRSVTPSDLVEVDQIEQAPMGGWVFMTGKGANRGNFHSTFLMDPKTGEFSRLASPPWSGVRWSRDGRVAAWVQPVGFLRVKAFEIYTRTVGSDESHATGIQVPDWTGFALSDDGARIAVVGGYGLIAVHDIVDQRVLASARVDDVARSYMFFTSPDVVRILQYDRNQRGNSIGLRVYELDVRRRLLTRFGERVFPGAYGMVSMSADGSRGFARTTGEIVDGRTLAPIAKLAPKTSWGSAMLNDGSVVIVDNTNGATVRLFDREGQPRGQVRLPNVKTAYLTAETTDGKLLFMTGGKDLRNMIIVDRNRIAVDRVVTDMKGPTMQWFVDPRTARFEAGQPFVGVDSKGKVKVWKAGA